MISELSGEPGGRAVGRDDPVEIVAGALRRTARPLVWGDDASDAFFLEIQGSGRVADASAGAALAARPAVGRGADAMVRDPVKLAARRLVRGLFVAENVRRIFAESSAALITSDPWVPQLARSLAVRESPPLRRRSAPRRRRPWLGPSTS